MEFVLKQSLNNDEIYMGPKVINKDNFKKRKQKIEQRKIKEIEIVKPEISFKDILLMSLFKWQFLLLGVVFAVFNGISNSVKSIFFADFIYTIWQNKSTDS